MGRGQKQSNEGYRSDFTISKSLKSDSLFSSDVPSHINDESDLGAVETLEQTQD